MRDAPEISVVIPVRNGAATIGACLESAAASDFEGFETIVVDDASGDGTREIAARHPCRLVALDAHRGAGHARNAGARAARGRYLFFTDADCVLLPGTLRAAHAARREGAVVGGTYTPLPFDPGFFNAFQSLFIHYSETSRPVPDYVAAHAMLVERRLFLESGGFPEEFLPILEDVEYSHRLARRGVPLVMEPSIQVRHIFGFTLASSLANAVRKARYWTTYSVANRDLHRDSGTASRELKTAAIAWTLSLLALAATLPRGSLAGVAAAGLLFAVAGAVNAPFLRFLFREGGARFGLAASLWALLVYPGAVVAGGILGLFTRKRTVP